MKNSFSLFLCFSLCILRYADSLSNECGINISLFYINPRAAYHFSPKGDKTDIPADYRKRERESRRLAIRQINEGTYVPSEDSD